MRHRSPRLVPRRLQQSSPTSPFLYSLSSSSLFAPQQRRFLYAVVSPRSSTPFYSVQRRRVHFHLCPQYQAYLVLLCLFLLSNLASLLVFSVLPPQWIDLCRTFLLISSTLLSPRFLRSWLASIHRPGAEFQRLTSQRIVVDRK